MYWMYRVRGEKLGGTIRQTAASSLTQLGQVSHTREQAPYRSAPPSEGHLWPATPRHVTTQDAPAPSICSFCSLQSWRSAPLPDIDEIGAEETRRDVSARCAARWRPSIASTPRSTPCHAAPRHALQHGTAPGARLCYKPRVSERVENCHRYDKRRGASQPASFPYIMSPWSRFGCQCRCTRRHAMQVQPGAARCSQVQPGAASGSHEKSGSST